MGWTNASSQVSLNELFFPVNIDWNRFPVESVLRALDPVLGITSVFPLVWAHLGLKLVEFVEKIDSRRSGEHFDEISVT